MNAIIEHVIGLDPFTQTVSAVAVIFFSLAFINLLLTTFVRVRNTRQVASWAETEVIWKRVMAETLYGAPTNVPTLDSKSHILQFIALWVEYQEKLRGHATNALNDLAKSLHLAEHSLKLLKRGNKFEKLSVIVVLGHLQEPRAFDLIKPYIQSDHSVLSLVAARALIQINPKRAIPLLLPLMVSRPDWPDARLAMMFHEAGREVVSKYLPDYVVKHESTNSARLIQFLRSVDSENQMLVVKHMLEHSGFDEAKVECLSLLQLPDDVKYASSFATHSNPKFRSAAVSVFARLGSKKDIPMLSKLASDDDLKVRFEAIRTIARLDSHGSSLKRLSEKADNTITNQMIREVEAKPRTAA